jgi:hypothetical protein
MPGTNSRTITACIWAASVGDPVALEHPTWSHRAAMFHCFRSKGRNQGLTWPFRSRRTAAHNHRLALIVEMKML